VDSVTVGLDIGSSAVRAAEIDTSQGRRVLRRYAQVGLPTGYVVDGDIINIPGVSAALQRLWQEGGFSETRVVLGVSGPRVFVRQAEVQGVNEDELRSALKFDSQELIPIPIEDATFDFSILEPGQSKGRDGRQTSRILVVAAHRELLRNQLAALKGAGLSASAIDATPLALMRAVPPESDGDGPGGVEVLVSIGSELTTVAVREGGVPRFIRSLTVGGSNLTETIANTLHLELALAERLKRGAVPAGSPQVAQARKAMSVELRDLAEDVRATIDFFTAQAEGTVISRLLITGGASQTEGLVAAIGGSLSVEVRQIDPFSSLTVADLGLEPDELSRSAASATTAIGLALWPVGSPLIRLSVLPEEVATARRARRLMSFAACGVAGLAGVLAVAGGAQLVQVNSAQHRVHEDQQQVAAKTSYVDQLQAVTAVHEKVSAQASVVVTALQGDIDWLRLIGQLAAVMPSNLTLSSISATRTEASSSSQTTSSASTPGVGTLSFTVLGTGGLPAVAAWLDGLKRDQSLTDTWVSGIVTNANGGNVTFSSTSNLTPLAESSRSKAVQQ
jgi:type IV pilus assembly protein PilM